MQLAIQLPQFTPPGGDAAIAAMVADTAQAAEETGCSTFAVMDHWFQMEGFAPAQDPMLEGYTTLGFVAAKTSSIRLSLIVTGVTYRHPGLLAKTITTLDVLSGGRAQLGIGAAWYEREHLGLGVPFPPLTERFERLEEALEIVTQMWSDDDGPYAGRHYQLAETLCSPKPLQSPRPPIMIGGSGERKTLRLVARHADACNLFASSSAELSHKLEVLERHCETEGRDRSTIRATVMAQVPADGGADAFIEQMAAYGALGIEEVYVSVSAPDAAEWVSSFASIAVPALASL